jgi:hypothetical protein
MTKEQKQYGFFQSARHERNSVNLLQKMAKHYGLMGEKPHHKQPSATALIRALIDGNLDLIDDKGRRFWSDDRRS